MSAGLRRADSDLTTASGASALWPYVAAVFLGATLLFSLEPLVGKLVLPSLGGAPAVWNTCLLFFQAMLLAGYAYTHYGTRHLGVRRHALLHLALVLVSLALLPPAIRAGNPPATGTPVGWLLLALTASIGLPFFTLSTTAPLVQYWLSASGHVSGRDPYFLYAASNLGSMTGLMLYPFVAEPLFGLAAQSIGWTVLYLVFAVLIAWLAVRTLNVGKAVSGSSESAEAVEPRDAVRWVAVAFVPSALLLTVTSYVTTDLAPMPLLWLVPLALYLATFVAAFSATTPRAAARMRVLQPFATLVAGIAVLAGFHQAWLILLHLGVLTITSYVAHARLAAERPHPSRLTAFYLWISVGGTLGGVFGAILAPLLLTPELEYVLLLLAALLIPGRATETEPPPLRRVLAGVAMGCAFGLLAALLVDPGRGAIVAAVAAAGFLLRRIERTRVALTTAALLFFSTTAVAVDVLVPGDIIARERNFFGTLRVRRTTDTHELAHGRTRHGAQLLAPDELDMPITYYAREGPIGDVFAHVMRDVQNTRVAVIGLGVGTVACYARPGQDWVLFEINPAVVAIARDTTLFRFLQRCAPDARLVIADGRLGMQRDSQDRYDLIILDAFSSDAIPAHLLTREAFQTYVQRLRPGGVLAVHISNRHLDLAPVIAVNAAAHRLAALIRDDDGTDPVRHSPSSWVALSPDPERVDPLFRTGNWTPLTVDPYFRPWTDDYTSLLGTLRIFRPDEP